MLVRSGKISVFIGIGQYSLFVFVEFHLWRDLVNSRSPLTVVPSVQVIINVVIVPANSTVLNNIAYT